VAAIILSAFAFKCNCKLPDIWTQDATEHFFGNNIFLPMGMIPPLK
jgi:hypothetical protein